MINQQLFLREYLIIEMMKAGRCANKNRSSETIVKAAIEDADEFLRQVKPDYGTYRPSTGRVA
jgi:hypothetical protein